LREPLGGQIDQVYINKKKRNGKGLKGKDKERDSIRLRQRMAREAERKSRGSQYYLQCFKEINALLFRKVRPRAKEAFRDGLVTAFFFRQYFEDIPYSCIKF